LDMVFNKKIATYLLLYWNLQKRRRLPKRKFWNDKKKSWIPG
jgi:hypothetical protein